MNPFTSKQATSYMPMYGGDDYTLEGKNIERSRRLAEAMQAEAMNDDLKGQMVSGIYVAPSWTQGLAKALKGYMANQQMEKADQREAALGKKMDQDLTDSLTNFQKLSSPSPEIPAPSDELGGGPGRPAMPGDMNAAVSSLAQSRHPMLRQAYMAHMLKALEQKKENPFGKVDPKDFTAASVAKFAASGNYADLVPVRKMDMSPSGQVWNPWETAPGTVMPDPNKPFSVGANGPVPNILYQNYELKKAEKGASKTTNNIAVNTEKNMFGQVADVVGKDIGTTFGQAKGAVGTINTVNQIRDSISTGNVNVGPGATAQQFLGQVGVKLGLGGKDEAERLNNTRKTIQGLAQLELDGASQLKGQGQITEGERDIVRRAASGEIDKLSLGEMRTLMDVIEKSARAKIAAHSDNMARMSKNKNAAPVVEYMGVEMPPAYKPSAPTQTPMGGGLTKNNDGSYTYVPKGR